MYSCVFTLFITNAVLVTQAAGVVLMQGIVCRAGWPRLPTATLQDGCKMNGLQRSARAHHSVAHLVSGLHIGQILHSDGSRQRECPSVGPDSPTRDPDGRRVTTALQRNGV